MKVRVPRPWGSRWGVRHTVIAVAAVVAVLGGAAWALFGSSVFVVRHVAVIGNRLVPTARILARADVRIGTPLVRVNTAAVARRVEGISGVLWARVRRSWPDGVVITVRERQPSLAVRAGGRFALIDGDGVVVRWSASLPAGMPLLAPAPAAPSALRGNTAVRAAAAVVAVLPRRLRSRVVSVTVTGTDGVTLRLRHRITVVWGAAAHAREKLAAIALLLRTGARYVNVSNPGTAVTSG